MPFRELLQALEMLDEPTDTAGQIARACGIAPDAVSPDELPRFEIFNIFGMPQRCRICGENAWLCDGEEWICDHSHDEEYIYVPMPVYDFRPIVGYEVR